MEKSARQNKDLKDLEITIVWNPALFFLGKEIEDMN